MDLSEASLRITNLPFSTTPTCSRRSSTYISRKTSWGTPIPPPSQRDSMELPRDGAFDEVDLDANSGCSSGRGSSEILDNITALGLSFNADDTQAESAATGNRFSLDDVDDVDDVGDVGDVGDFVNQSLPLNSEFPFNRWLRKLERRAAGRRQTVSCDVDSSALERERSNLSDPREKLVHKKSSSGSSFGFVTAVKSASISLASLSIAPHSKRTGISSRHQRTDRSSKASQGGRHSEDNSFLARGGLVDEGVTSRLLQRRRVLEELISTEESYVADVKFLAHVYVTLLASIPNLSFAFRVSITRNLNEIIELHEELLGDLHRVVPHSEYTQPDYHESSLSLLPNGHHRWRSLDAVPENGRGSSWLQKIPGLTAEPKVAAEVARIFGSKLSRFFIYEEYGAKYELMIRDTATMYRTMPQWEVYQKGFEALASSLSSMNSQHGSSKKALAIGDLLVKPIQRVCKYPLLFAELLKQTPVCDCPDSHLAIDNVLVRIRETTTEINRATDDPRMKVTMEKSWVLQDRLVFPDRPDTRSKIAIRGLGHIHLCGVLHVSWQTKSGADGQYLISLLYRDFLLLASTPKLDQVYIVQACIGLNDLRIEEIDNGRGLQCHTVPFSWKLVFEYDHQLFEITMSACSQKEELEWRGRLVDHSGKDPLDSGEQAALASLSLSIKSMGTVFGKPGTIARRISIHRAMTVGPISGMCQVIIKNTNAFKEAASSASINRSQSLLATNRTPVLAPSRADRMRLEALLADVWTREVLPYPGMTGRARNEHLVRTSASSMMRKLSVASIASNFTKRSSSMASLHKTTEDDLTNETDSPARVDHILINVPMEIDDSARSRLSMIPDERENVLKDSFETLPGLQVGAIGSPASSLNRLAALKSKKSWRNDGHRIITPPLRTSSANSVNQIRTPPASLITDSSIEDKENIPRAKSVSAESQKPERKGKGHGRSSRIVPGSIRSFFR
ncbi:Phosphatidylinositol 3,4,5-trisphosphate-dependent Rac exchanger 1 protein [Lachnellula arida]|uniref:Phosphatidylinositol 3,4,5-trisphosphate-dependent Rac exchanger 1 protein n=1 Tax=Lachnellula arida TaxID=1316785 RepID=A0A8T9BIR5_9HELO|nr:Phosphatidylinositol 3,4,5-trisphosphate-dependent Rac exchanger 1 protein [Lachnellula arida]